MSIFATAVVFAIGLTGFATGLLLIFGLFADIADDIRKERPRRFGAAGRMTHQEGAPGEY